MAGTTFNWQTFMDDGLDEDELKLKDASSFTLDNNTANMDRQVAAGEEGATSQAVYENPISGGYDRNADGTADFNQGSGGIIDEGSKTYSNLANLGITGSTALVNDKSRWTTDAGTIATGTPNVGAGGAGWAESEIGDLFAGDASGGGGSLDAGRLIEMGVVDTGVLDNIGNRNVEGGMTGGGQEMTTPQMVEDWIRAQFGGPRDTGAEEGLIRELLNDRLGQQLVGQRARMGRMGMAASGASGAIEGDIRRRAAQDILGETFGVQRDARQEELARASAAGNMMLGLQRNELDAAKEDFYNRILAQLGGADAGGDDSDLPSVAGFDVGDQEGWDASNASRDEAAKALGFKDADDLAAAHQRGEVMDVTQPMSEEWHVVDQRTGDYVTSFYRDPKTGIMYAYRRKA